MKAYIFAGQTCSPHTSAPPSSNSLGAMPKRASKYVQEELEKWRLQGVEGHFNGKRPWMPIDERCCELLVPLVGAQDPTEIAVMNTLSLNCHLFMISFYRPTAMRYKILIEANAFCSDHHVIRSQLRLHGFTEEQALIQIEPKNNVIQTQDILDVLKYQGDEIALVFLGGVNFLSGQLMDMETITKAGHERGCFVGFDLAHCVGNVPVKLHDWEVDFACWCHYKYVNSGPGCIGGAFMHSKHNHVDFKRLDGWWGQEPTQRFRMESEHVPKLGARSYQLSNPPVLPMVCLQASLEIFNEAGVDRLREKSIRLTSYLESLLQTHLPEVQINTPPLPWRGAQLSLEFPIDIEQVHQMITAHGVICDIRRPNVMRIAPAPLYNSFTDVHQFVMLLKKLRAHWTKSKL